MNRKLPGRFLSILLCCILTLICTDCTNTGFLFYSNGAIAESNSENLLHAKSRVVELVHEMDLLSDGEVPIQMTLLEANDAEMIHCLFTVQEESFYFIFSTNKDAFAGIQFTRKTNDPGQLSHRNYMYATYLTFDAEMGPGSLLINDLQMKRKEFAQYLYEFYEKWTAQDATSLTEEIVPEGQNENSEQKTWPGEKAYQRALNNYDAHNDELALELFQAASDRGHPIAKYYLGIMYLYGWGTDRDLDKSVHYFIQSAQMGVPEAMLLAGTLFRDGIGVEKNIDAAINWFTLALESESSATEAKYELAKIYYNGVDGKKDYHQAYTLMEEAANAGDINAQFNLGVMMIHAVSYSEAEKWLNMVLEKTDDPQVYYYLGLVYINQDRFDEAVASFETAAEANNPDAIYYLGSMYFSGEYVEMNKQTAYALYTRAAELGQVDAQFMAGLMLISGDGITEDQTLGIEWIRTAAESGNEFAATYLESKGE